jgi:hypothetical protein
MMRKLAFAFLLSAVICQTAVAGTVSGTLQEDFSCPNANCTSTCVGPGGETPISDYKDLSAWVVGQPDRLWLQKIDAQNNISLLILGVGDRCIFVGTPLTIQQTPQVSSLGLPPVTQCTCIGTRCTPPGCAGRAPEVSPLR